MTAWKLTWLFASVVLAHSGLKTIVVDGTRYSCTTEEIFPLLTSAFSYAPFDSRIDHLLGPVRRIEWSHDVLVTAFNPITNLSNPALACKNFPFNLYRTYSSQY
jgi:hypothetical protein